MLLKCYILILTILVPHIFRCQDNIEWKYVGPNETKEQIKGMFKSVWVDENNHNYILAGSACGGLFKTENALAEIPEWINITDTYEGMCFGVSDIVVKSNSGKQSIYIATGHASALTKGYGNGILKTSDGGKSWKHVGPSGVNDFTFNLDGLVMNKENEAEMIAYGSHDVYITKDDWQTYETVNIPIDKKNPDVSLCDVDFAPYEPGKFYVCSRTCNVYESKIFVCENYGKTVKDIFPKDVKSERVEVTTMQDKKYKGKFYLALGWTNCYVQFFDGRNFSGNLNAQPINHTFGGAYWNFEFAVNQTDSSVMYVSLTETSRSTDGGKTFEKISHYNGHNTHADNRAMLLAKSTAKGENDILYLGNDGGISKATKYGPANWINLNGKGLNASMFWGVGVAQSDTLFAVAGAHDNGGFMIKKNSYVNTMNSCGDGYMTVALDENSAIIECNTPSMYYHNLKTKQHNYLQIGDDRFDGKRPLIVKDTFVYTGYANVWRISKRELESGRNTFSKVADIPVLKRADGVIKNNTVRGLAIGNLNSAAVSYRDPNWYDKENTGKLFFCSNINNGQWTDITDLATDKDFSICRWNEISAIEMDIKVFNKFYFVCRDVYNQTNSRVYEMEYSVDSNKAVVKEIGRGLPKIGINRLKIDKFSNIIYAACDNGIYFCDLNKDSVTWAKLNGGIKKLPNVMVFDIDFNYVTNSVFAATYGRGLWQTELISSDKNNITINKNITQNNAVKIDGTLTVNRKKKYSINSKLIITKASTINLKKGSILYIRDRDAVRDENNTPVNIFNYVKKHRSAKVIYGDTACF